MDYQFVTTQDTAVNLGNSVEFSQIPIYEGTYVTTKYLVDSSDVDQRYLLVDSSADTTTLRVRVQNSSSDSTVTTFTKFNRHITTTPLVMFIIYRKLSLVSLRFTGDGVVGRSLSDGNIVGLNMLSPIRVQVTVQIVLLQPQRLMV